MAEEESTAQEGQKARRLPERFVFHGNAVGAEVYLTRIGDIQQYIAAPVSAQSSLPVIGGISSSAPADPEFPAELKSVFSYTAPMTGAEGRLFGLEKSEEHPEPVAITTIHAGVSNVSVTNRPMPAESADPSPIVFTASKLTLRIKSTHLWKDQPNILFDGPPVFQDLTFKGLPIELEFHDELMKLGRWKDLEKRFRHDRDFFESCSFEPARIRRPPVFGQNIPRAAGSFAVCSFVRSITWGGRKIPGHVLVQPGFGTIYFGEILLNDRERRVTMVRMRLGSLNSGQAVFAENAPNGTWIPPR